jgi:hypothetical protein
MSDLVQHTEDNIPVAPAQNEVKIPSKMQSCELAKLIEVIRT